MEIRKVKFVNSGLKGIQVEYDNVTEKDSATFNDRYTVSHTAPVHKELKKDMQRLKYHVLRIYKLVTPEFDGFIDKKTFSLIPVVEGGKGFNEFAKAKNLMDSVEITSVTSNRENFLITAKMRTLGELKVIMNTPLIDENADYPYYDDVIENIVSVYDEVEVYINSDKPIDNNQLVIDFYTSKGNTEKLEEMKTLSPEQIKNEALQLLENMGAIVMMPDEIGSSEEPVQEAEDGDWGDNKL